TPPGCPHPLWERRAGRDRAFRPLRAAGAVRPRGGGSHNIRCDNRTTRLTPPPVGASPSARLNLPATPSCRQYSPPGRGLPHYSERWPSYPAGPTPCRSVALGAIEPSGYSELPALFAPGAGAPTLFRAMTEPGSDHSALGYRLCH